MKKIMSVLLSAALVFAMAGCGGNTTEEVTTDAADTEELATYNIGICQLVQHDALDKATQGFRDALTEKLGDRVTFDEQNAAGDSNTCATIVNSFVSNDVDLILANATAALQAAASATDTIPVLGTSITDYATALELDDYNGTVGGNVSGTSDLAPLEQQADMLLELYPDAQNVGLLYCSAEPNSVYQVNVVKTYLEDKGLTCAEFSFADSNDVASVTTAACDASDVIYVPTDNTVANCAELVGQVCVPAGVPVIAGESGICQGCGVATLSIDYYQLGYQTGLMAYEILEEGADISTMAIRFDENPVKKYNPTICEELGLAVPEDYEAIDG